MKIIEIIEVDGKKIPAEPFPAGAKRIFNDGTKYIIYEEGDELPPIPQPTEEEILADKIETELMALDMQLPRSVEDLAKALNVDLDLLPREQKLLYSRKTELRQQRKQLKDGNHGLNRKN